MNIILLSGGSGKRLWPLSNDVRSKQFIKLFKNNDEYESMVQRVYRQITTVDADAKITIATSKSQASAIKNQLGEKAFICVEPCRRDTFPAIALAAAYLHDELGVAEDEAVIVCPVDPYVDNTYYEAVKTLQELAEQGGARLNQRCIFTVHLAMFPSQRKTSGTALTRSCTSGWKNTVICRSWYGKALEKANSN